jgi:hypothetical protein
MKRRVGMQEGLSELVTVEDQRLMYIEEHL